MIHKAYNAEVPFIDDDLNCDATWRMLRDHKLDFRMCTQCYTPAVVIIESGGGLDDILDESNGAVLSELAAGLDGFIVHHGMYEWTSVCIDPALSDPDDEDLLYMLEIAEGYAEYPVLDEDDYSRRELESFQEEFRFGTYRLYDGRDESHPLYAKAGEVAMELFYGYSDAGYISIENVEAAWRQAATNSAREFQANYATTTREA